MSHAGMGPAFAEAKEEAAGRYKRHLTFRWREIGFSSSMITLPGGKKVERQIDVRGVRPN